MIDEFTGKYRFLSNFYPSPINHGGVLYPTVEHAYNANKTLDWDVAIRVSQCKSAGAAKRMGRTIRLRHDWEQVKLNVMEDLVRLKFANFDLFNLLKATCPHELQEGNWWGDTYWGTVAGSGHNHLGKILMKIRGDCA
jgi:N-glycosidase YbiA